MPSNTPRPRTKPRAVPRKTCPGVIGAPGTPLPVSIGAITHTSAPTQLILIIFDRDVEGDTTAANWEVSYNGAWIPATSAGRIGSAAWAIQIEEAGGFDAEKARYIGTGPAIWVGTPTENEGAPYWNPEGEILPSWLS